MERQKLYSPPSGHLPQEIPNYCRFEDGTVRRDLPTLSDIELNELGWDGPFYWPIGKIEIKNENLTEEQIEQNHNNPNLIYDSETQVWTSIEYDYDPKTQKYVWYSKERRFIFVNKDEDTSEYEIPYKSYELRPPVVNIPSPTVAELLPPQEVPLWYEFKLKLLQSPEFNQYVGELLQTYPIIATSLPLVVSELENEYTRFLDVWNILKTTHAPSEILMQKLIEICLECKIPQDFIDSLNVQLVE